MAINLQSGIRQYNGDLSEYTGMLGGLTPDVHTLRSLNPETTNRVLCVMFRGPYFLMHYYGDGKNAYTNTAFRTYKKLIEYYNMGIQANIGDGTLTPVQLMGGFAGRSISIPTTQNTQQQQSLVITVPELVGRPVANFHNMWIDGISDPVTGLTTYHGLVSGGLNESLEPERIFYDASHGGDKWGLEPSPAYEVAEFLLIALDRSGARVEAATMALGCYPSAKVGNDIFNMNQNGNSQIQTINLSFNCQFIQSAYVNDLASRYVKQFAVFGNSLNLNPGAGDAFFRSANSAAIDTEMFNGGNRPSLDAVQSGVGNAPVFSANQQFQQHPYQTKAVTPYDHSVIHNNGMVYQDPGTSIQDPYSTNTVNPG